MVRFTVKITTDSSLTEYYFTNKENAYTYALHLAEAGYNVEIHEAFKQEVTI